MFRKFKIVKVDFEVVMSDPSYVESIDKVIRGEDSFSTICGISDIINVTLKENQSIILSYPNGVDKYSVEYIEKHVKDFINHGDSFLVIPNEFNFFVV